MRVLVTGANGMLGSSLCPKLEQQGYYVFKSDVQEGENIRKLNVCDFGEVEGLTKEIKPEMIFHLAAATDLDWCEKNPQEAYEINKEGTDNIAKMCRQYNILMVYISTSDIFDGIKFEPYIESDKPNPINVYGKTKLEGELAVRTLLDKYFIFRVCWLIGGGVKDKKFVGKIINLVQNGAKEIKAVNDRFGSPTFADDFAINIMSVVKTYKYGCYHMANKGGCSRFEIARKIIEYIHKKGEIIVSAVTSDQFPSIAPKPRSVMMTNYQLELLGLNNMLPWEEGLENYINKIEL